MSLDAHLGSRDEFQLPLDSHEDLFDVLSHPRRSALLSILRGAGEPLRTTDLATRIVARDEGRPLVDVTRDEHDDVLVSLRHHHLPALAERDVVDWNPDAGTVALADGLPFARDALEALLDARAGDVPDALFRLLANERRRAVLDVLSTRDAVAGDALSVTTLATAVAAREIGGDPDDVSRADRRRVRISLHHSHLPKLDAAGVIEYDRDDDRVALRETRAIDDLIALQ